MFSYSEIQTLNKILKQHVCDFVLFGSKVNVKLQINIELLEKLN